MIPPGEGELRYVVWELTLKCDLACDHCGSRAGKPRAGELSTDEALAVVAQLAELGVFEVTLIGGEAYLHAGFALVARAIHDAGIRCTLGTGGRGITPERAKIIADAGVRAVGVSIDGDREAHDLQRGVVGSWDSAVAALDNLGAAGVTTCVNTQINRVSSPYLEFVLNLLLDRGARGWQLQLTVPMGRAADRPEWLLQPYELVSLFPRLAAMAQIATEHEIRFGPSNNIGYFGPLQEQISQGDEEQHFRGCVAGKSGLGIESDGSIKGCPSLPSEPYRAGNVRDTPIATLRASAPELRFNRTSRVDELWGFCAQCYYRSVCQGGCSWMAHSLFGRRGNNPYCHHRALELKREGLRERVVRVAPAMGQPFDFGRFELITEPWDTIEAQIPKISHALYPSNKRRLPVIID